MGGGMGGGGGAGGGGWSGHMHSVGPVFFCLCLFHRSMRDIVQCRLTQTPHTHTTRRHTTYVAMVVVVAHLPVQVPPAPTTPHAQHVV